MRSVAVLACATFSLAPQQGSEPAPRQLNALVATINAELSAVTAVRELRNGHLLVSDPGDRALKLVDPRTGATRIVGAKGQGPGEYSQPGSLYSAAGDTTFLFDRGQPRYLVIAPDGKIVDTRSLAAVGMHMVVGQDRFRIDAAGRLYTTRTSNLVQSGARTDSTAITRIDLQTNRTDTVATLRVAAGEQTRPLPGVVYYTDVMFAPADAWALLPDGRIVIARAEPYRVEVVDANGRRTVGPVTAHETIPVTAAERQAVIDRSAQAQQMLLQRMRERMGANMQSNAPNPADTKFAATKPPFGEDAVLTDPGGRIWIRRNLPFGSAGTIYDLFDANGVRTDRIRIPARSGHSIPVAVGFGADNSVYVSRQDSDGVPVIEKYAIGRP